MGPTPSDNLPTPQDKPHLLDDHQDHGANPSGGKDGRPSYQNKKHRMGHGTNHQRRYISNGYKNRLQEVYLVEIDPRDDFKERPVSHDRIKDVQL